MYMAQRLAQWANHGIKNIVCWYFQIDDRRCIRQIHNKWKKEEIWLSPMTKAPTPTEKSKKQRENTKTPPKTSITQRLQTDLGVTTATQLVWLNRFTGSKPSH